MNDEVPGVRVKYKHGPRLESVLSADEESSAYDIVYKRDYSEDDMIIFGKKNTIFIIVSRNLFGRTWKWHFDLNEYFSCLELVPLRQSQKGARQPR